MGYILALDQGTTSSRAIIFDKCGRIVGKAQREFKQLYPAPGYAEHDPRDILGSQTGVIPEAIVNGNADITDIDAIHALAVLRRIYRGRGVSGILRLRTRRQNAHDLANKRRQTRGVFRKTG